MKNKFKFGYSLLQYEHNPWLKERLNIGILMFAPSEGFLELKTRSWSGRVLSSYPRLEKANFTEDLNQIKRTVLQFRKRGLNQPQLVSDASRSDVLFRKEIDASEIGRLLSPDADSSYRWVEGGVGLCSSLESKLDSLFDRFVTGNDKEQSEEVRSDGHVWSTVNSLITERQLDQYMEAEPSVQTSLGKVKFQSGYQNGAFHVIQPLSFDLKEEEGVSAKAAKWGSFAISVEKYSKGAVKPHFVLGRPTSTSLDESFHRAHEFLRETAGTGSVITEEEAPQFVDEIEDRLLNH